MFSIGLLFRPAQEISHRYGDRNQLVVKFDLQEKGHRFLIAASMDMDVLPCDAGNFSRDPFLEKFSDFTGSLLKGARN